MAPQTNYNGTRRSNFVKPENQTVVAVDVKTLVHANFVPAFVEVCDFGAKGVTIELLGKIGNMNASYHFGDAGTRLAGKDVVAFVGEAKMPRTSTAKEETWNTSKNTGDAYRIIKFGSKATTVSGSAFDEVTAPASAF